MWHGGSGIRRAVRAVAAAAIGVLLSTALTGSAAARHEDPLDRAGWSGGWSLPKRYATARQALTAAYRDTARRARQPMAPETRAAFAARASRYAAWLASGRRFLLFDPDGRGLAAEVLGDLESARHVAVLVPGNDVDLDNYDDPRQPLAKPRGMAKALLREAAAVAPGERLAVVVWVGYVTPQGLGVDAAREELAEAGARSLVRFLAGLAAAGHPATSLFCHSYGSVVCGLAARRVNVRDIVVLGSPGMHADTVADLHTRARIWAVRAPGDWIRHVPHLSLLGFGHGRDPVDPAFGARVLSAAGVRDHDGYFAPGTASLRAFAQIALQRYGKVR